MALGRDDGRRAGYPKKTDALAARRGVSCLRLFLGSQNIQLSKEEYLALRFQIGTLKRGQHVKYLPRVFTEQGVAMLSGVHNSPRAVLVNIAIMRAFVRLREILAADKELAVKFAELERKVINHDTDIQSLFDAIRELMAPPIKPKRRIGFQT